MSLEFDRLIVLQYNNGGSETISPKYILRNPNAVLSVEEGLSKIYSDIDGDKTVLYFTPSESIVVRGNYKEINKRINSYKKKVDMNLIDE